MTLRTKRSEFCTNRILG